MKTCEGLESLQRGLECNEGTGMEEQDEGNNRSMLGAIGQTH